MAIVQRNVTYGNPQDLNGNREVKLPKQGGIF